MKEDVTEHIARSPLSEDPDGANHAPADELSRAALAFSGFGEPGLLI